MFLSRTLRQSTILSSSTFTRTLRLSTIRFNSTNALTKTELPFTYSSEGPSIIKYTNQHEWIAAHKDGVAFIGITKYAADALGDATYIELPEQGSALELGESFGSIESVKSASDVYSPVNGEVLEPNEALNDSPQFINEDPLGKGWLTKVQVDSLESLAENQDLLSLEAYQEFLKSDQENH
ncbi:glycine decarboxylase subunit H SCDLUD_003347 [Saccharomycodes ludwigii]|uniref:glycine decarboxylase subunit H n=1 Tax=Saccharomycodes ludwigii TaxID=36035 RepID=UPI001E84072E|nr:hypothetical protein SCDLUD_003347 [Saccharomycodes ludwigii]KAH3900372.1 hypothetical protein SCDLUD_003347 [Saccharomycodes ludwigii]